MVSTRLLLEKLSSPCTHPMVTVPRAPITICINVIFMFRSLFNSLARSRYLSYFRFLLILPCGQPGPQFGKFSFSSLIIIKFARLDEIKRSVCISKSQRSLCVLFSRTDSGLGIYHLFVWSNLNFLHSSP